MRRLVALFMFIFVIAGTLAADNSSESGILVVNSNPHKENLSVDSKQEKLSSAVESNQEKGSSAVDNNQVKESSAVESNEEKESLSVDSNQVKESSAVDSNQEKESSSVDSNQVKESSYVDSNQVKESSAVDSNQEKESSSVDSNQEKESSSVDSNQEKESSSVDSNQEKESSSVDSNQENESSAVDSNSENVHSSEETSLSIESEEDEGVSWIHDYDRNTYTNEIIDFNIYQIGENEECYLERNNEKFTFEQLLDNKVEGITPHNSDNFVSCRVTIGPMTEHLLGRWILIASHVKDGITYHRKQAMTLKWRSQRLWDINENRANHVVNFGAIITPFINRFNNVEDCHLVTPDGVDLYLLPEFKYPNITRLMNSRTSCAVEMGPMYTDMLGDWVIYGVFGSSLPDIVTRPLHIFLYDEENPYEQAYNRTIYEPIDHVINLGTIIKKKLTNGGNIDECNIMMPDGEIYSLQPGFNFAGVTIEDSSANFECSIVVGPVDKDMLGEYKLVAKFSNNGIFTELQQEFKIIQEDPANPIEDSSRRVEYLTHQFLDTDMGKQLRITITLYAFQQTDSCHIRTPDGLQYTIMEGFNIPGVEVIEDESNVSCGVVINVVSEELIGNWTLISRKTQYDVDYREERLPITIYVEEIVNASPIQEAVVAEGNNFYIRLEEATTQYETCVLYDPNGDPATSFELDERFTDSCGFIIRKVKPTDNGRWEIKYGRKIVYIAEVFLNIQAAPTPIEDSMELQIGRPVDLRLGDPNSIFCRVEDPSGSMVFHGFGVCRIQLDKVTHAHEGFWKLYVGVPGHILTHQYFINVTLIEPESPIQVDTSVVMSSHASVLVSCGVTTPHKVLACKFMDPWGRVLLASHGLGEDRYTFHGDGISFDSGMYHVDCGLKVDQPEVSDLGLWRCAIQTEKGSYYGFLSVLCPWSMQVPEIAAQVRTEPVLTASKENIEVLTGDKVKMLCKVSSAIRYCYFMSNNGTVINLSPDNDESDIYSYIGEGFQAGECGLQMKTRTVDDGLWTCKVGLTNTTVQEQIAVIRLKVEEHFIHDRFYLQDYSEVIQGHSHKYMPIEYCRFVRSDGFAFNTENAPMSYDCSGFDLDQGQCGVQIHSPTILDKGRWTIIAKIKNQLDEIVVTSEPIPPIIVKGTMNRFATIFYLSTLILLIATILLTVSLKRSKRRIVSGAIIVRDTIRNSIRKKPLNDDSNLRNIDVAYAT